MNLLIVESPGKVKKVKEFLENGWNVAASVSYVRDLPDEGDRDGICPPDFRPNYVPTERDTDILTSLVRQAQHAGQVYLALTRIAKARPSPASQGSLEAFRPLSRHLHRNKRNRPLKRR